MLVGVVVACWFKARHAYHGAFYFMDKAHFKGVDYQHMLYLFLTFCFMYCCHKQMSPETLVDTVPSCPEVNDNNNGSEEEPSEDHSEPRKKTRRSRRGGYRRKRQQQKKIAALMAASAAERARKLQVAGSDSASTATTEEESSSCESSGAKSAERVVARKKGSADHIHQQRPARNQQYYQHPAYYQQAPAPAGPPMYPYPAYAYPAPFPAAPRKTRKLPKELSNKQKEKFVALDCEMVEVAGCMSSLARVTLLDWHGNIVMDELVKPQSQVTDYRTFVSGITKEMLDTATMDFGTARRLVLKHLKGKILVGHGLKSDLGVLGIRHPWYMIRDTAMFEPYMKVRFDGCLWPRSLKELCKEKLDRDVQVCGRPHCPKEDALAALDLYRLVWRQWEKTMEYKMNTWAMQPPPPTM